MKTDIYSNKNFNMVIYAAFIVYIFLFFKYSHFNQEIKDPINLVFYYTIITSSTILYFTSLNIKKDAYILFVKISLLSILGSYTTSVYTNHNILLHQYYIDYSAFILYRSIYFYLLVEAVIKFTDTYHKHILLKIYAIYIIISLLVFISALLLNEIYFLYIKNSYHHLSYILKSLPFVLCVIYCIRNFTNNKIIMLYILSSCIICITYVIYSMSMFKTVENSFFTIHHLTNIISILIPFILIIYSELRLKNKFKDKDTHNLKKLTERLHDIKNNLVLFHDNTNNGQRIESSIKIINEIKEGIIYHIPKNEKFNINDMLNEISDEIFYNYDCRIDIKNKINDNIVYGNKKIINSIFSNLLLNSAEFIKKTKNDGVIYIRVYKNGLFKNKICVEIENKGEINIKRASAEEGCNFGIGLTHTKEMIEKIGGSIKIKSLKNPVIFCINFPI